MTGCVVIRKLPVCRTVTFGRNRLASAARTSGSVSLVTVRIEKSG